MYRAKRVLFNAFTFLPGAMLIPQVKRRVAMRRTSTGGTNHARYCYSVWLRHLTRAYANGMDDIPKVVAELGPGDSIGIGLAATLCGAQQYYAFDVVAYANAARNVAIFDTLVELFRTRAPVPGPEEFPRVGPPLNDYSFPRHVLTEERLQVALHPERLARIRESLLDTASPSAMISYRAPWNAESNIERDSVDMVFSQAVLEHVDYLEDVYRTVWMWLRSGGYMSHQIDFKCHDSAREWNGHWTYSDLMWSLIRGRDNWLINREPHSTHVRLIERSGFKILENLPVRAASSLQRRHLARRFRSLSDDDLVTSDAFIQAVKLA